MTISVDRISVSVPGLSTDEGQQLARRVGDGLSASVPPGAGPATVGRLSARTTVAGGGVDEIAERVLAEIAAELRRHL